MKILVVSSGRSDFFILEPLIRALSQDSYFDCHLLLLGEHGSGLEVEGRLFEDQGLTIHRVKVTSYERAETRLHLCKTSSRMLSAMAPTVDIICPDLALVLGDRYEIAIAALCFNMLGIDICHLHGGEVTEGAVDEHYRHAITKLSKLHFCASESYRKRIVQMGEDPALVYNVGSLGVERLQYVRLIGEDSLRRKFGITQKHKSIAVATFHPESQSLDLGLSAFNAMIQALSAVDDAPYVIFTRPCREPGHLEIESELRRSLQINPLFKFPDNVSYEEYISLMARSIFVIGNSSSGIIEAPSFCIPVINVGRRQQGRLRSPNIIDASSEVGSLTKAIKQAMSPSFAESLKDMVSPFEGSGTAGILAALKSQVVPLPIKTFRDLGVRGGVK